MKTERAMQANLEKAFGALCNCPVQITVRGEKSFTFSAEGNRDLAKITNYLSSSKQVKSSSQVYDEECDLTCLYIEVA